MNKYIDVPIFPVGFWFITGTKEEANKFLSRKAKDTQNWITTNGKGSTVEINLGDRKFYSLWLAFDTVDHIEKIGILSHEITHLIDLWFDYIGIEGNWTVTEPRAYLTEYLITTCLSHLTQKQKVQKSKKQKRKHLICSSKGNSKGWRITKTQKYRRMVCTKCGHHFNIK